MTMDFRQSEVGGNLSNGNFIGFGPNTPATVGGLVNSGELDLMMGTRYNMAITKERFAERPFELQVEAPRSKDLTEQFPNGESRMRPGMVSPDQFCSRT